LFRFLSEAGRQEVGIHLADQELRPQEDIQVVLEKQPNPKSLTDASKSFVVRAEDGEKTVLREETVELEPLKPVAFSFRAEKAGVYSVIVSDPLKVPIATRVIEVRDANVEFENTARDMETLRQWASVSDGLAMKVEDCRDAGELVGQIKAKIEEVRRGKQMRRPAGVNACMLGLVLGTLGTEWVLRKRWGLV